MTENTSERDAVLRIYAEQDEAVRQVMTEVLKIEREALHLRDHKHTIQLVCQAIKRVVQ